MRLGLGLGFGLALGLGLGLGLGSGIGLDELDLSGHAVAEAAPDEHELLAAAHVGRGGGEARDRDRLGAASARRAGRGETAELGHAPD